MRLHLTSQLMVWIVLSKQTTFSLDFQYSHLSSAKLKFMQVHLQCPSFNSFTCPAVIIVVCPSCVGTFTPKWSARILSSVPWDAWWANPGNRSRALGWQSSGGPLGWAISSGSCCLGVPCNTPSRAGHASGSWRGWSPWATFSGSGAWLLVLRWRWSAAPHVRSGACRWASWLWQRSSSTHGQLGCLLPAVRPCAWQMSGPLPSTRHSPIECGKACGTLLYTRSARLHPTLLLY